MRPSTNEAVFVDFETATSDSLTLTKLSTRAYVLDPRFEVLAVALALGGGPISFFHKHGGLGGTIEDGIKVLRATLAQGRWLVCHNTAFDGLVLKLRFGLTADRVFDTLAYAAYLGLGKSLKNLARHIGLRKLDPPPFDESSLKDPALLAQLARYTAADVQIARRAFEVAVADQGFPDAEFEIIDITQRNNLAGLRLDTDRLAKVTNQIVEAKNELFSEIAAAHPFDTSKLNSNKAIRGYLAERFDVDPPTLRKDDVQLLSAARVNPVLADFIHRRQKVRALARCASQLRRFASIGEVVYSPLRYYGAHTGRFSGSGKVCDRFNLHSLPKAKKAPHPAVAQIRSIIVPKDGKNFVAADLATIEARVVAALAGEEAMMRLFRERRDIYVWLGNQVFPGKNIVKNGENDYLRNLCKEAVLGLGFGMGIKKFLERVLLVDSTLPAEDVKRVFATYQNKFPRIAQLRKDYWRAFVRAADFGVATRIGRCLFARSTDASRGLTVAVHLPTGRRLFYRSIETTEVVKSWGPGKDYWYAPDYEYEVNPDRHRGTHGAKVRKCADGRVRDLVNSVAIVENIVQAVARDILMHQMLEVQRSENLRPLFHVHDELVCECPPCTCGSTEKAMHAASCPWVQAGSELVMAMSRIPASLSAIADIPVEAELSAQVRGSYGG